jgi:hypothetical protein
MDRSKEASYVIPARYRQMENMHILFWLVKDISWCLVWKPLGIAMIFPTLIAAIVIAWRTREVKSELAHNLAVIFWIVANSYWMIAEFFGFDETMVWHNITGVLLCLNETQGAGRSPGSFLIKPCKLLANWPLTSPLPICGIHPLSLLLIF